MREWRDVVEAVVCVFVSSTVVFGKCCEACVGEQYGEEREGERKVNTGWCFVYELVARLWSGGRRSF